MSENKKIAVIGLGYVGLPLAIGLSKNYQVTGFDIHRERIEELRIYEDRTNEISSEDLKKCKINFTSQQEDLTNHDIFIVTVPTPVDEFHKPDLTPLMQASELIANHLQKNNIVVYESTVYPGVTEEFCGKILEEKSNLVCGKEFFLGYSPERVNPGDQQHSLTEITKVVSGQNKDVTRILAEIYASLNKGNIFKAKDIKTAEAAKVIENAQRDINIAFINEISMIYSKLGLSVFDILETAETKWNFLPFKPGLVGGHCIGVDPYYLAHLAKEIQHHPHVILSGREINETMAPFLAEKTHEIFKKKQVDFQDPILLLGLSFKENIPDLRNSKVVDYYQKLVKYGYKVEIFDPHVKPAEALKLYNLPVKNDWPAKRYSAVILAVAHSEYADLSESRFSQFIQESGVIFDLKGCWRKKKLSDTFHYFTL